MESRFSGFAQRRRRGGIDADSRLQQRRPVNRKEEPFGILVAHVAPGVQGGDRLLRDRFLGRDKGILVAGWLSFLADLIGPSGQRAHERVYIAKNLVGKPQRMQTMHPLSGRGSTPSL